MGVTAGKWLVFPAFSFLFLFGERAAEGPPRLIDNVTRRGMPQMVESECCFPFFWMSNYATL